MDHLDRYVRHFLKVAELRSMSKAASALDLTQPGLSRQIAALESMLGKPLFIRTGRGVELTDAGKRLRDQTEQAFRAIDEAIEYTRYTQGVTRGTVRLATVHTLSYYFVADVTARFMSQHEGANLSIMGRGSPEVVSLVEDASADLGFVYDTAVASRVINSVPLFEEEMCLIVRLGDSVGAQIDLTRRLPRLVGFPPHYALRRMMHSSGLNPMIVAEAETIDALLELVSYGVGACILPSRIPDKALSELALRKVAIAKPTLRRRVVLIVRSDRNPSPLVRDFIESALIVAR